MEQEDREGYLVKTKRQFLNLNEIKKNSEINAVVIGCGRLLLVCLDFEDPPPLELSAIFEPAEGGPGVARRLTLQKHPLPLDQRLAPHGPQLGGCRWKVGRGGDR